MSVSEVQSAKCSNHFEHIHRLKYENFKRSGTCGGLSVETVADRGVIIIEEIIIIKEITLK